ncbi:MAG: CHAT domain-containing protein [Cytophagaceae bacterium]|nr:CHAT domain-containing protein [Cytophagaceae bacterium]
MRHVLILLCLPILAMAAPPKKFTKYYDQAVKAYGRGRFSEALDLFQKAEKEKGSYSDTLINRMYFQMADAYEMERKNDQAASYYQKSLEGVPLSPLRTQAAYRQGNFLLKQSRLAEAERSFRTALESAEATKAQFPRIYALIVQNLGILKMSQGEITSAEPYFLQAIQAWKNQNAQQSHDYANACNNLAILYSKIGELALAESYFAEYLNLKEKLGGKNNEYATGLNNLAVMHFQNESLGKAEKEFQETLSVLEKNGGKETPMYATTLNNLGLLYWQWRQAHAEKYFAEAVALREKISGKQHPAYATHLSNLGAWMAEQGSVAQGSEIIAQAKEIRKSIYGTQHPDYIASLLETGTAYMYAGQWSNAKAPFVEACDKTMEYIRANFPGLTEREKIAFANSYARYFDRFSQFAISSAGYRGKNVPLAAPSPDKSILEKWLNIRLASKGMVLQSMQRMRKEIMQGNNADLVQKYQSWEKLSNDIVSAYNLTVEERKQKNIDLAALETQARQLEKELSAASASFAQVMPDRLPTWIDIRKKLKMGEAAVEIVRIRMKNDTAYAALLVTAASEFPDVVFIPNGKALETRYIHYYRNSIQFKTPDQYSYSFFWKPVGERLAQMKVKRVFCSPDGVYHLINLNTLQNTTTGKYVQDELELYYLSNLKELMNTSGTSSVNKALLIGNPDYNLNENKIESLGERAITIDEDFKGLRSVSFSDLPGTDKEVKNIGTALKGKSWDVQMYSEKEATEERIKEINDLKVLHIATHGFFIPANKSNSAQAMMNSGVVLAGVSADPSIQRKEDGILTAAEASNLHLENTDLVVLSACESGLGNVSSGEGVFGIQRGLRVAGARALIMSLWKVNDEATQELMSAFYAQWTKTNDKALAFRLAQQQVRKKFKDPYYWGAFVMVGI